MYTDPLYIEVLEVLLSFALGIPIVAGMLGLIWALDKLEERLKRQ
jgi:hypothetical protein